MILTSFTNIPSPDKVKSDTKPTQQEPSFQDRLQAKKFMIFQDFEDVEKDNMANKDFPSHLETRMKSLLDEVRAQNQAKQFRADETDTKWSILSRDQITSLDMTEQEILEKYYTEFELQDIDHMRMFINNLFPSQTTNDPQDLFQKLVLMKEIHRIVENKLAKERDSTIILKNKQLKIRLSKEFLENKNKKSEFLLKQMNQRFKELEGVEFAAENKLARAENKLKGLKNELESVFDKKREYFKHKMEIWNGTEVSIGQLNEIMARNLILLDEKKEQNQKLLNQIEDLNEIEKVIQKKHRESETVVNYLELMEEVVKKHVDGVVRQKTATETYLKPPKETQRSGSIPRIVISQPLLMERRNSKTIQKTSSQEFRIRSTSVQKQRRDSAIGAVLALSRLRSSSRPSSRDPKEKEEEFDRGKMVQKIQEFYEDHEGGVKRLRDRILNRYSTFNIQKQSLQTRFEELTEMLQTKNAKLERKLSKLTEIKKHRYVLDDDQDEIIDKNFQNRKREISKGLQIYTRTFLSTTQETFKLCYLATENSLWRFHELVRTLNTKLGDTLSFDIIKRLKEIEDFLHDIGRPSRQKIFEQANKKIISQKQKDLLKKIQKQLNNNNFTSFSSNMFNSTIESQAQKELLQSLDKNQMGIDLDILKENREYTDNESDDGSSYKTKSPRGSISGSQTTTYTGYDAIFVTKETHLSYEKNQQILKAIKKDQNIELVLSPEQVRSHYNKFFNNFSSDVSDQQIEDFAEYLSDVAREVFCNRATDAFKLLYSFILKFYEHSRKKDDDLVKQFGEKASPGKIQHTKKSLGISEYVQSNQNTQYEKIQRVHNQQAIQKVLTEKSEDVHPQKQAISPEIIKSKQIKEGLKIRKEINTLYSFYTQKRTQTPDRISRLNQGSQSARGLINLQPTEQSGGGLSRSYTAMGNLRSSTRSQTKRVTIAPRNAVKSLNIDDFKKQEAEKNEKLIKKLSDDPDEDHFEKLRRNVKYGDLQKELEQKEEQKKLESEKFIPTMIRQRYKPAWDGIFKKFKDDKRVLTKLKTFEKHQSEFDIKTKDADRMHNYIPAVDLLVKIKTMTGDKKQLMADSDMIEWGRLGLDSKELKQAAKRRERSKIQTIGPAQNLNHLSGAKKGEKYNLRQEPKLTSNFKCLPKSTVAIDEDD